MIPFPQAEVLDSQAPNRSVCLLHSSCAPFFFPGPGKDWHSASLEWLSFSLPFTRLVPVTLPVSSRLPVCYTRAFFPPAILGLLQAYFRLTSFKGLVPAYPSLQFFLLISPHHALLQKKKMLPRQEDNYTTSCLSWLVPESLWDIKV